MDAPKQVKPRNKGIGSPPCELNVSLFQSLDMKECIREEVLGLYECV